MASLSLYNITKFYAGDLPAVNNFNLEVEDKEFIVLVGPSGCGKSTLLRMIAGLESPDGGEMFLDGKLMNRLPAKLRSVAVVSPKGNLYSHMSVYNNLAFGLRSMRLSKEEIDRRVRNTAEVLGITSILKYRLAALPDIQRRRVSIGRALVREPKVVLLDEPLSNLDLKQRIEMRSEIILLHKKLGVTFICATQDSTEAMAMASRIVIMRDGEVQQIDTPQNLYDYPENQFVGSYMGVPGMNFFRVRLERRGEAVFAMFGENAIQVPAGKVFHLVDEEYIGREVILGMRPENLHNEHAFLAVSPESIIEADVQYVELMGSETYLHLMTSGKEDSFVARVAPRSIVGVGDRIRIAFDPNRLHFFDPETQTSILSRV